MLEDYRFVLAVEQAALDDVDARLARTRWPNSPVAPAWSLGTDIDYLRSVVEYWRSGYDWRAFESQLNSFAHYLVPVDDLRLHVIVEPGSGSSPRPLVLLNGWPSSIAELVDVIEPLAHPERFGGDAEDAFTVIAPTYPGYGFSDAPAGPLEIRETARLVRKLIRMIVPEGRYHIHGGDVGAAVASWIAFEKPQDVAALHLNSPILRHRPETLQLGPDEQAYLDSRAARLAREGGYQVIQGTKPQTLSYGLTDSPVGLAAWILEKFKGWVVPGTDEPPPMSVDILLNNVMIYWLRGINTANWTYCDFIHGGGVTLPEGTRVAVPTAIFMGDKDLSPPAPEAWIRRSYDLVEQVVQPGMGHFPWIEAAAGAQMAHLRAFARRCPS